MTTLNCKSVNYEPRTSMTLAGEIIRHPQREAYELRELNPQRFAEVQAKLLAAANSIENDLLIYTLLRGGTPYGAEACHRVELLELIDAVVVKDYEDHPTDWLKRRLDVLA